MLSGGVFRGSSSSQSASSCSSPGPSRAEPIRTSCVRRGSPPPGAGGEAQEAADRVDLVTLLVAGDAEPDEALDPVEAGRAAVEEVDEAARGERLVRGELDRLVGRVQVAVVVLPVGVLVFRGLREQVLEGQLPPGPRPGPAVEEQLRVDPPVFGSDHGDARGAERGEFPLDAGPFGGVHAVGLVQHHEVGDGQVAVGLGVRGPGRVELGRVDDLHQAAVADGRILVGHEHPDHLLRLGESAGLDDDHVDPVDGCGELLQVRVQFAAVDRAAQAAAAERDHRVADLPGHGHRVDLDRPEVVDDDPDPGPRTVGEQVVEHRGLAGTEESGEDDDRNGPGGGAGCLLFTRTIVVSPAGGPAGAGSGRRSARPAG